MHINIGKADRAIRAMLGIALISMVFIGPQTAWGWLGLTPLGTALFRWCPLYAILGISTVGARRHAA